MIGKDDDDGCAAAGDGAAWWAIALALALAALGRLATRGRRATLPR